VAFSQWLFICKKKARAAPLFSDICAGFSHKPGFALQ
jgi:hypothetical protein